MMKHTIKGKLQKSERARTVRTASRKTKPPELHMAFYAAPLPILGTDAEGRITSWNGAAEQVFGWTAAEAIGKICPTVPPQEMDDYRAMIRRALQGETSLGLVRYRQKKGGSLLYCNISASPVPDAEGQPVGTIIILEDITERKQAEEAVHVANQRLNMLLQKAPLAIVAIDSRAVVQTWNAAAEQLFGWTSDEVVGRPIPIVPEEERHQFGELLVGELKGEVRDGLEMHRLRKDGPFVDVSLWTAPLLNSQNEIVGTIGMFADITARKSYEATIASLLQISQNLHRNLEIDRLLESLTIEAMKLTDSELGWAGVPTEKGMTLVRHISGEFRAVPFEYTWAPGIGWPGWVLARKEPYLSNDARSDSVIVPEIREHFGVRSGIDTPILDADGNVLGFFEVNNKKNGAPYTEDDVQKLMAVSRIASIALQNASSYQNLGRAERALAHRVNQQVMVTALGQLALAGTELLELFDQAVAMVSAGLGAEYCKVLEWLPHADVLKLVVGIGWKEGVVGHATVPAGRDSQAGYTLFMQEPVIVEDFNSETRFSAPSLLRDHDVVSGVSVVIGSAERPFGVLGAHTKQQRSFSLDDAHFLQSVANVLAEAIQRKRAEEAIRNLSHRLMNAQENERRILARELHDEIGQELTGLRLSLATNPVLPLEDMRNYAATINKLIGHVRNVSLDLHPSMLDDLGLLPTLLWHIDRFSQQTKIEVDFQHTGVDRRFTRDLEIGAFRIIQEALTNVARHAQTDRASVRIWTNRESLQIQIEDRGVGFDVNEATESYDTSGLTGIRERVAGLGGSLSIESNPNAGTRLYLDIPLHDGERDAKDDSNSDR